MYPNGYKEYIQIYTSRVFITASFNNMQSLKSKA